MLSLFLALTAFNLLCLALTAALGYWVGGTGGGAWHQLAGVAAALTCCAVHCVVFTYFIATAKWVRHAIAVKRLDPALAGPTRSFKLQAFPPALLAMAATFVAAVSGAAALSYELRPTWHHALAWVAVAVNAAVAVLEYRAIARNARLIDRVLEVINAPAPA
jgi:uncharacterized membrane protein